MRYFLKERQVYHATGWESQLKDFSITNKTLKLLARLPCVEGVTKSPYNEGIFVLNTKRPVKSRFCYCLKICCLSLLRQHFTFSFKVHLKNTFILRIVILRLYYYKRGAYDWQLHKRQPISFLSPLLKRIRFSTPHWLKRDWVKISWELSYRGFGFSCLHKAGKGLIIYIHFVGNLISKAE